MKMNRIEKDLSAFFQAQFRYYGLPGPLSRVIAVLYLQPEEISMEDLARKTGYSLASISNSIKVLDGLGMAERIRKPGSRRVYVFMEKDLIKLNLLKLRSVQEHMFGSSGQVLPALIARHRKTAKDRMSRRQLQLVESYGRQIRAFEHLTKKWIRDLERLQEAKCQSRIR